jgi:hypothetical protein
LIDGDEVDTTEGLFFPTDEEATGLLVLLLLLLPRGEDFLDAALAAAGFLFRRPDEPVLAFLTTC